MASVKKYNGNLTIQTPFGTGVNSNITLDTDTVYITGNLFVRGNTSEIASNTLSITDNIITLNDGETGNGVTSLGTTSGIVVARGTAPGGNVALRWNETTQTWQVSGVKPGSPGDGTQYLNISTTTGGSALSAVVDDPAPVLGGNLNVNGFVLYANVSVNFSGNIGIINTTTIPTTLAGPNTTLIYTSTPDAGQSGIYVINSSISNEELVTKRRAFGFSLLL